MAFKVFQLSFCTPCFCILFRFNEIDVGRETDRNLVKFLQFIGSDFKKIFRFTKETLLPYRKVPYYAPYQPH